MMAVTVKRGDVVMICTTQAQLDIFLEDGYKVVEEAKPKTASRKKKAVKQNDDK